MKHLALITTALFLLSGCVQQADTGAEEMDELSKQNVELVKKLLASFENEDLEATKELFAEGCEWYGPRDDQYDTVDNDFWAGVEDWYNTVDSLKYDVIAILPHTVEEGDLEGDWVFLWCFENWYSIENEKSLRILWHCPMLIEDGKIVYVASIWNQWDLYKQLGAKLEWEDDEGEDEDEDTD